MRQIVLVESALLQQELNKEIKEAIEVAGIDETVISVSTKELGELKLVEVYLDISDNLTPTVFRWYDNTNMTIMNLSK